MEHSKKEGPSASALRKDPYEVLCVSRDVSDQEIENAYRKLALKYPISIVLFMLLRSLGCSVYDLESAAAVYRNRISLDPTFLTSEALSVGGFYDMNRRGQVFLHLVSSILGRMRKS